MNNKNMYVVHLQIGKNQENTNVIMVAVSWTFLFSPINHTQKIKTSSQKITVLNSKSLKYDLDVPENMTFIILRKMSFEVLET